MNLSHHAEQAVIAISNKTTIIAGSTAAVSGAVEKTGVMELAGSHGQEIANFCMMGGFVVGVAGFFVSVWFQWRRDRREEKALRGFNKL